MRICLLVPFLFSFYIKGSSQNILAAADSLYTSKNYSASAQLYLKAASRQDFKMSKAGSYYNAACCFALESKKDSAFTCLWTAKDLGWNNKYHLLTDKDLESLHKEHEWKKL